MVSKRFIILMGLIAAVAVVFLVGCGKKEVVQDSDVPAPETTAEEQDTEEEAPAAEAAAEAKSCTTNSECDTGKLCIDSKCGALAELYSTDCDSKCTIKDVTLTTSDGQLKTVIPGRGDYTKAGALEWSLAEAPASCDSDKMLVPFKIVRNYYGEKLSESIITVEEGETSVKLTHPNITSLEFTLKVTDVETECS